MNIILVETPAGNWGNVVCKGFQGPDGFKNWIKHIHELNNVQSIETVYLYDAGALSQLVWTGKKSDDSGGPKFGPESQINYYMRYKIVYNENR